MADYADLKARLRTLNLRVSTSGHVPVRDLHLGPSFTDALTAIEALEERVRGMRGQGQSEGWAAAVGFLRNMSAIHPPASLSHAASLLADQLEDARQAKSARATLNQESPDAGR
jgi:hypothetical protein